MSVPGGRALDPTQPGYLYSTPQIPRPCRLSPSVLALLGLSSASALLTSSHVCRLLPRRRGARTTHTRNDDAGDLQEPGKIDSNERLEERPMMHGQGRVHPAAAAASSSDFSGEMNQSVSATSDPSSGSLYSFHLEKLVPPQPGTYVVQVPKDKVFRVPPPENARLFEHYTRRAKRRRRCSCVRVCTWTLAAVLALAVLLAAAAGVMYLAFRPKRPAYAVQALAVSGLGGVGNASAPGAFSPAFDATVRADNPSGRIGVHYDGGASHVSMSYDGVLLAEGAWPAFYQGPRNVTLFVAKANGAGLRLSQNVRGQMAAAERLRSVTFDVDVEVPVRLQLGKLKTWAMPVRARCTVAVDRLAADTKVVSKSCSVNLRLLFWWS